LIWQNKGNVDKALEYYVNAVKHDPFMVTAWINMTSVYLMLRNDVKALEAAKEAAKLEPDFPVVQNNLAVALYYNNDFQAARTHVDRAIKFGYEVDPRFLEALSKENS
jgi:tetratricopeptide (TPR) repeat protein